VTLGKGQSQVEGDFGCGRLQVGQLHCQGQVQVGSVERPLVQGPEVALE